MDAGNISENLVAAYIGHTAVIRVEGRGSFKISPPLKQFIHQIINNQSADTVLIEMSHCTGMDSTFMGVVAGIACFLKSKPTVNFELVNVSSKNKKLMATLGVDRVVNYSMTASDEQLALLVQLDASMHTLEADLSDKLDTAKTTLEAHEKLVEINPDNFSKFKSVLEFLKDDVRNLSND